MSWNLQDKEFETVCSSPASVRYEYFIKKIADSEELWSLWDRGWALLGDGDGELVPAWRHSHFAGACAIGEWQNFAPKRISLDDWLTKWIPGMEADHRRVAVFPVQSKATTVSPTQLKLDIENELLKYGRGQ